MEAHRCRQLGSQRGIGGISTGVYWATSDLKRDKADTSSFAGAEEGDFAERGPGFTGKERDLSHSRSFSGGLLSDLLPRPQEDGGLEADHQSQASQPIHQASEIPDGNIVSHTSSQHQQLLGDINRSERCVPAHSHSPGGPQVAQVQHPGSVFCVPMFAFWPVHSAESLYPRGHVSGSSPAQAWSHHIHVPRRLVGASKVATASASTYTARSPDGSKLGPGSQRAEVPVGTNPESGISGGEYRSDKRIGHTVRGKSPDVDAGSIRSHGASVSVSQEVAQMPGSNGEHGRHCSTMPTEDEDGADAPSRTLHPDHAELGHEGSNEPRSSPGSPVVDPSGEPAGRCEVSKASPSESPDDGCFEVRLGGPHGSPNCERSVVSGRVTSSHQCVGNDGSPAISPGVHPNDTRMLSSGQVRQLDGGRLSEQRGRHPFEAALSQSDGLDSLVQGSGHNAESSPHPRDRQRHRRQPVKRQVNPAHGMGSAAAGCATSVRKVRSTGDRPVRDTGEQATPRVLRQALGQRSVRHRRAFNSVVGDGGIRVPASTPHPPSSSQGSHGGVSPRLSSTILAPSALVSTASESGHRDTRGATGSSRTPKTAGKPSSFPRHQGIEVNCLETVKQRFQEKGFSAKAAEFASKGRRDSTYSIYNSRLRPYIGWCRERGLDPARTSVPNVADFLVSVHEAGLKAVTIGGYLSAIKILHVGCPDGKLLKDDYSLILLIEGFHNSDPPQRKVCPAWDLEVVLEALNKAPYEPALSATLRHFTIKTIFLLALSSARRVSELHAISVDSMIWPTQGGVIASFKPGFLAKNETSKFSASPISLASIPMGSPSHLSCPVRALKWYLKKTELVRSSQDQLFLCTKAPYSPAKKNTLAGWVVEAIQKSLAIKDPSAKPRAHSVRSVSSTIAFSRGVSLEDIMETVCWKSKSTFITKYMSSRVAVSAPRKFADTVLSHGQGSA